jgi:hypothetical protein
MFYQNSKNTNGIKYVTEENDLLIFLSTPKTDNVEKFTIENEELHGKEYEIICQGITIYMGTVEKDKNMFPIENFPHSEIEYMNIYFLVKNVENKNIDLNVKYTLTKEFPKSRRPEKTDTDTDTKSDGDIMHEYDWPLQPCKFCKKCQEESNMTSLVTTHGMAGLRDYGRCFDINVSNVEIKKIVWKYEKVPSDFVGWKAMCFPPEYDIRLLDVTTTNNKNLSIYSRNSFLLSSLVNNNKTSDVGIETVVVENRTERMVSGCVKNLFEHEVTLDAIRNIEFICQDNEIEKVEYVIRDRYHGHLSTIPIEVKKTSTGYAVAEDNLVFLSVSRDSFINVYATGDTPIYIKHCVVAFDCNIRRSIAQANAKMMSF